MIRGRAVAPVVVALWALALVSLPSGARAGRLPSDFYDGYVASYLSFPVGLAFLPDGRPLVVEKVTGNVKMILAGPPSETVTLVQVDSVQAEFEEQGLLGIAVDPRWPELPYVYVYYDAVDSTIRLSRFRASGDLSDPQSANLSLDPASRYDVLRDVPDQNESHNGGTLRFGPDGMLYTALADDWDRCASQDSVSLHGVLLRLDVRSLPDGPGGPPSKDLLVPPDNPWATHPNPNARLVWASGFRNPFRFHIDPADGVVYVTDVGWSSFEEVDRVDAPGQNFGWPYYEAASPLSPPCVPPSGTVFTPPIFIEDRRAQTLSVSISAGVYRPAPCVSCNFPPEYDGDYFFADFYRGFIRRLKRTGSSWAVAPEVAGQPASQRWGDGFIELSDFLRGPDGALWYVRTSELGLDNTGKIGRIYYFVASAASVPERNHSVVRFAPPAPSPARSRVRFAFEMDRAGMASLGVFDASGRRVARVLDGERLGAGDHVATWSAGDGRAVAGIYFARLTVDGVLQERRFAVIP